MPQWLKPRADAALVDCALESIRQASKQSDAKVRKVELSHRLWLLWPARKKEAMA